jgi:hypothetical protein
MHGPINVKSPNNTRKWQMGFNSAFKSLMNISAMTIDREDRRILTETCPIATLFTPYLIWRRLSA